MPQDAVGDVFLDIRKLQPSWVAARSWEVDGGVIN
jgi:hypothetical protein